MAFSLKKAQGNLYLYFKGSGGSCEKCCIWTWNFHHLTYFVSIVFWVLVIILWHFKSGRSTDKRHQRRTTICDSIFVVRGCENWYNLRKYGSSVWQLNQPDKSLRMGGKIQMGDDKCWWCAFWAALDCNVLRLRIRSIRVSGTTEYHHWWYCLWSEHRWWILEPKKHFILVESGNAWTC
jgi:hypothetical protein